MLKIVILVGSLWMGLNVTTLYASDYGYFTPQTTNTVKHDTYKYKPIIKLKGVKDNDR